MTQETTLTVLKEIRDILKIRMPVGAAKEISKKSGSKFLGLLQDSNRFEKLPDGWIKDRLLGIDWAPKSLEKKLKWKEAQEYAAKFERQPEVYELETLLDRSKYNPAIIDAAKQLELESNLYWSGTTYADSTDYAWFVYFNDGDVYYVYKVSEYYVRPVRSSQ
jgi:hypothetical protein